MVYPDEKLEQINGEDVLGNETIKWSNVMGAHEQFDNAIHKEGTENVYEKNRFGKRNMSQVSDSKNLNQSNEH